MSGSLMRRSVFFVVCFARHDGKRCIFSVACMCVSVCLFNNVKLSCRYKTFKCIQSMVTGLCAKKCLA